LFLVVEHLALIFRHAIISPFGSPVGPLSSSAVVACDARRAYIRPLTVKLVGAITLLQRPAGVRPLLQPDSGFLASCSRRSDYTAEEGSLRAVANAAAP
jgi:hypothetical protein